MSGQRLVQRVRMSSSSAFPRDTDSHLPSWTRELKAALRNDNKYYYERDDDATNASLHLKHKEELPTLTLFVMHVSYPHSHCDV